MLGLIETHMIEPVLSVTEEKLSIVMLGNPIPWVSGKCLKREMVAQLFVENIQKRYKTK